ncbi:MAG: PH domain-containing protein [Burkholderiales bacterium]|nr:PH domain-containing protein [Phycisphaerae bacterium]
MSTIPSNVTPPHETSQSPMDDQTVYYEGSPKLRGEIGILLLWTLAGIIVAGFPFLVDWSVGNVHWVAYVVGFTVAFILWIIPAILVRRNFYRITNYRIDYEHGLIVKKMDTLELWHVDDVSLTMGPLDRMLNVGTIVVKSNDDTTPRLELKSLSSPRQLLETLKTRIISVKRQRGVVKIDGGGHDHDHGSLGT